MGFGNCLGSFNWSLGRSSQHCIMVIVTWSILHISEGHFNVVKKFENPYFSGTLDRDMLRILFHLINANLEFLFPLLIKAWCKALSAI